MIKKIILLVLYFLEFYIRSLWGKKYLTKSQEPEPHVFGTWSLSRSRLKKDTRNRSRSRLGKKLGAGAAAACKKLGAGAAKKISGSSALLLAIFLCLFC